GAQTGADTSRTLRRRGPSVTEGPVPGRDRRSPRRRLVRELDRERCISTPRRSRELCRRAHGDDLGIDVTVLRDAPGTDRIGRGERDVIRPRDQIRVARILGGGGADLSGGQAAGRDGGAGGSGRVREVYTCRCERACGG